LKTLFYIVLFLLVALHSKATNLLLEVKENNSGIFLNEANLRVLNKSGNLTIERSAAGFILKNVYYPVRIKCSFAGYESRTLLIQKKDVESIGEQDHMIVYLERSVTQIGDVVITGQVTPLLAKQSVYKVNTVSASEIAQRAAVSLNDVLNYEMNNFVANDNLLGSSVNIGGIGGQNVKVLVNGIPVMGRENGTIDMGQLNLNNIKRIEMIQGPMSVMYGSNALGGVINLITATPKKKFSVSGRSYTESIGRYNFSANASAQKKNHQLQLSVARNFFYGWTPKDSINRFQLWKPKTQYTGDLQYWLSFKKLKLNYFASYLSEKITNKGEPIVNAYEGYAFDEYYRTNRMIHSLAATTDLTKRDQLTFTNSFQTYKRTKNRLKKDLVTLNEFETMSVGDQDTTRFYDLNLRGTYSSTRLKNTNLLLGYEYARETGVSFKLTDERQIMSEIGVFSSAAYTIKAFQIQPSIRVSHNNRYKTNVTPAIHAKLDIGQKTQVRGSYARGFRAPTLKEMYLQFIDQNHTIIGNLDLKPEIGNRVEIGLDHQSRILQTPFGYTVNISHNSIQNLIALAVFNNHGVLRRYDNIANYKNWILSVKGNMTIANLSLNAGTGMIFVENTNITPQHTIFECTVLGSYKLKKLRSSVNINYKFNSRQPVITVDQQFLYTSPLHIANVSLQRSFFNKAIQAQIGLKNLFNIQNASLSGTISSQNSPHSGSGAMQLFPARSFFVDVTCSL